MNGVRGQAMACDGDKIYHVQVFTHWKHSAPFIAGKGKVALTAKPMNAKGQQWSCVMPIRVTGLVAAGDLVFAAGRESPTRIMASVESGAFAPICPALRPGANSQASRARSAKPGGPPNRQSQQFCKC